VKTAMSVTRQQTVSEVSGPGVLVGTRCLGTAGTNAEMGAEIGGSNVYESSSVAETTVVGGTCLSPWPDTTLRSLPNMKMPLRDKQ
jgi:hypothetical protein